MRSGTYPPALPKWEGGLMSDGFVDFPKQCSFSRSKSLSPLGEIREGLRSVSVCRGMGVSLAGDYTPIKKDFRSLMLDCNCLLFDHLLPERRHFFGSDLAGGKSLRLNGLKNSCRGNSKQFQSLAVVILFPIA
jgi:hypothetical protein